ncbi:hypothetical protein KY362_04850 [Candidatus Woesearchaeota archaeon]|nr:hypothetical protein [Candidatus Woesearchaeota archaeon]
MKSAILFQVLLVLVSLAILHSVRASADQQKTIDIKVELDDDTATESPLQKSGKVSFSILSAPETISTNSTFKIRLLMQNPTEDDLEVDAWSYVYRSSKCYSGEREANKKRINLPQFSNVTFDLENIVDASPGNYSLKVKFLRTDRKTPFEITRPIVVIDGDAGDDADEDKDKSTAEAGGADQALQIGGPLQHTSKVSKTAAATAESAPAKNSSAPEKRRLTPSSASPDIPQEFSETVYESSSARARRFAGYILIAVLTLVLVALITRKF